MSQFRRAHPGSNSILGALQATELVDSRAALPAEILVAILDHLPVPDLMRFARVSRRMQEMVYDDTRWVARLKSMGVWNEVEARRRFDEAVRRRRETLAAEQQRTQAGSGAIPRATGGPQQQQERRQSSITIFDASAEQERRRPTLVTDLQDGFQTMTVGGGQQRGTPVAAVDPLQDPNALVDVLKNVRSARGHARQEYGKVYGALAPFYFDLARAKSHTDPVLFQVFRDPERQAQMLSCLHVFSRSDWADGCRQREERVTIMMGIFETAVLREFEQGYEFWDVEGRMRRYAHVLDLLNGGNAAIELFVHKHPIFSDPEISAVANPIECLNQAAADDVTLEPSRQFFETVARKINAQASVIEKIFPKPRQVFWVLVEKIKDDIIMEYATPLFDECHERSLASYLQAVSGVFEQTFQFFLTLELPPEPEGEPDELNIDPSATPKEREKKVREFKAKKREDKARDLSLRTFEPHLDLYLQDELDFFIRHAEDEVGKWETRLSEQDASVESFYMSSFNRQADKKDFLSSFKKVVMMPVTVLPSLPGAFIGGGSATSTSAGKPPIAAAHANGVAGTTLAPIPSPGASRPQTPGLGPTFERRGSPLPEKAPTDELAAKAALMASRLEGIKSLFSIEVALSLVHAAKVSLGRGALFIRLGGQVGGEARELCESIFVNLLRILGGRHVKPGFDKAVEHLSHYKPRDVAASDHDKGEVAPLVMFIELVNLGDLISQMVDVFYEQQLAAPKIADRNDFLDPAGMAKKKFEQMLDESVAAGLNKGIDVLMDEVEYICATTQQPTDYNPLPPGGPVAGSGAGGEKNGVSAFASTAAPSTPSGSDVFDIGPTQTAKRVVELVSSHTSMLVGTTEKSMLDVFNGEVGLRLFQCVSKHLKRQRVSTDGAIKVIADMNHYFQYVRTLKNPDVLPYFVALRELSQIYLIDPRHSKEMAVIIADSDRFGGVFRAEEVYKFAERRADWYQVRRDVEKAMYGLECAVM